MQAHKDQHVQLWKWGWKGQKGLSTDVPSAPPGVYTPQAAVQGAAPHQRRHSRLRGSPPPGEPRRRSYSPGLGEQCFPEEEEEDDWGPPARSVVGMCGTQHWDVGFQ